MQQVNSRLPRLVNQIGAVRFGTKNSVTQKQNAHMRLTMIFFLLFSLQSTFAQLQENDFELGESCSNAIPLSFKDANFSIPEALGVVEMEEGKSSLNQFHKELNLTWYKFTAPENCLVGFEIRPLIAGSNLDFILFPSKGKKTCELIDKGAIKPVRKNLAKAGSAEFPLTGLSAENQSIRFDAPIEAKKGSEFYLVVNNVYATEGHQIRLKTYKSLEISGVVKLKGSATSEAVRVIWLNKSLDVIANGTKTDSTGNFVLKAIVDETDFGFEDYELVVSGKGCKLVDTTFSEKKLSKKIEINLDKIDVGEVAKDEAEHLYFRPNSADKINDESTARLANLLKEMRFCPSLKIQLEGHSNGVYPSTEVDSKLSYTRAQSIKDYLVSKGIERHRIFIKAYGSSKQLYPKAKNEEEESRNRRVEVRYLEF